MTSDSSVQWTTGHLQMVGLGGAKNLLEVKMGGQANSLNKLPQTPQVGLTVYLWFHLLYSHHVAMQRLATTKQLHFICRYTHSDMITANHILACKQSHLVSLFTDTIAGYKGFLCLPC